MAKENTHIIDIPDVEKIGVYAIYNKKTQKYYIGSSVNIKRRMKEHRDRIEKMNGSNLKIDEDLKTKSDVCNFCFIVLESFDDYTITETFLREREAFYIKKYDAYNGYNDEYRTPSLSGYFNNEELLFCKKYRSQKVNKSDLETMSNEQLLKNYKISVCKSKKTNQIELFEAEILRRIKNKH